MVAIFTTASILDNICHTDDLSVWQDMIVKLGEVFVDGDVDIPLDMEDPLFILDSAIKIDDSKKEFITSIPTSPEMVLQEPCGIFLLDIPEQRASEIQSKYGVICQSPPAFNHNVLTQKGTSAELVEGMKDKTWSDIFKKFKDTPTNSALIIDAHLFENDQYDERQGCYDKDRSYAINNLKDIIDQILPDTFADIYHIGILLINTDEAKAKRRSRTSLTNARIASAINKLKKKISRPYEINIEVIFFSTDDDGHKLIHNRRILTNTYVLDTPYKLAAFESNGISRASQTITVKPLFELIHIDTDSDMKEKRLRYDLDDFYGYIETQCRAKAASGQLYCNGTLVESFYQVKHRFLT